MKFIGIFRLIVPVAVLASAVLACGLPVSTSNQSVPNAPIAPITVGSDLTQVNVCTAVPAADFEAALGRKPVGPPQSFNFYGTAGASTCMYDAGKDSNKQAYYGYVVLTPIDAYNNQPLSLNVAVSGIGQAAYFNNGADDRQLWVKVNDTLAFVVGIGDVPDETDLKAIAQLVVAAIK